MTYLQMVNNLLRRLRERTVAATSETDYATLLGILINDAKREVENSWDWSSLRTTIDVATVASTHTYSLNDSLNRVTVLDIWNNTEDYYLEQRADSWIRKQIKTDGAEENEPRYFTYAETASDGDTQIMMYPVPDAVYDIEVRAVLREGDLTNDADTTLLPSQPIRS